MWQERQSALLRDEINTILDTVSDTAGFLELVEEPLMRSRRGLAVDASYDRPWPLIPLIVCDAISGHFEHILPAAAGLQFLLAAGDVFDDIEDADSSESLSAKCGPSVATNVATILLILAEKAILRLKERSVEDYIILRVMDVVNSYYVTVCTGQHLDLSLFSEGVIPEDEYLRVVSMKSASQIECACHIGALLAAVNQELIDSFTKFGYNLGMAAQIANDIQGITRGSDIVKPKITLPVIYALAQTDGKTRDQLENIFVKQSEAVTDPAQIKDLLLHIGAIHYATVKLEFYKQHALDILSQIESAGPSVERLKLFL